MIRIDTVINACDAGREGELIFRLVYNQAKCKEEEDSKALDIFNGKQSYWRWL